MQKTNLVYFTDIVRYAENNFDIPWNDACNVLDRARPCHEISVYDFEINEFDNENEWTKQQRDIMVGFMKEHNMTEMSVVI